MMNSMQPSGALARSRLGTATKKMIALLLAAVMFLMLGVVGVMVGKAATTPPEPSSTQMTGSPYSNGYDIQFNNQTNYLKQINGLTVNGINYEFLGYNNYNYYSIDEGNNFYVSSSALKISKQMDLPATVIIHATNYDDLVLTIDEEGIISTGPSKKEITIQKEWSDGNSNHNNESISYVVTYNDDSSEAASGQLNKDNNWSTTLTIDADRAITIREDNVPVGYIAEVSGPTDFTIGEKRWTKVEFGKVSENKTYALVYNSNGTYYLISRSGTRLIGTTSNLSNGTPNGNLPNDSLWELSTASNSSYLNVKNLGNNQYLNIASNDTVSLVASPSYYYSAIKFDTDGSVWNKNNYSDTKYHQLYATGSTITAKSDDSFTPIVAYELVDNTETFETYTITNTKTDTPPAPTKHQYTLTYDANGGTGEPVQETSQEIDDESYNFTVSSTTPTRNGYVFKGWADDAASPEATYRPGDTITLQKDSPSKTIYAVWEISPPEHHKSITFDGQLADSYVISLNVTGKDKTSSSSSGSTQVITKPSDILLVIDVTTSMKQSMSSSDSTTRMEAIKKAATQFVNGLNSNSESNISLITFGTATASPSSTPLTVDQDWISLTDTSKSTLISAINSLDTKNADEKYGQYTFYTPPLNMAEEQLDKAAVKNSNNKYVIFFSDGDADDEQTTIDPAANAVKAKATVFSIGLPATYWYQSTDKIISVASDSNKYYEASNSTEMISAFNNALNSIKEETSTTVSTVPMTDVIITDTLSEYVEQNGSISVTASDNSRVSFVDQSSGKTIAVKIAELKDGVTYTLNIPVKPSAKAKAEATGTTDNPTKYFSNQEANLTYTYGSETKTSPYEETPQIAVAKEETKTYSYELKFDANEGDASKLPDTQTATTENTSHEFTIPNTEPTRDHYSFQGWATSEKATTPEYKPGDTITLNNSTPDSTKSQTLYAVWKYVPETDYVLHKTSHAMFILSALCAATAGAMFAVEHYRRKRLTS